MKDGLYQYKYGRVCAGFIVRFGQFIPGSSAPIMKKIKDRTPYSVFWRRSKWIAPLNSPGTRKLITQYKIEQWKTK